MYNTYTAKQIGSYNNGLYVNDFGFYGEALYQKKTGEFFLVFETYFNIDVLPTSEKKAKIWCEEHISADKYIALFGKVDE